MRIPLTDVSISLTACLDRRRWKVLAQARCARYGVLSTQRASKDGTTSYSATSAGDDAYGKVDQAIVRDRFKLVKE